MIQQQQHWQTLHSMGVKVKDRLHVCMASNSWKVRQICIRSTECLVSVKCALHILLLSPPQLLTL